jgi:hypothetical protein
MDTSAGLVELADSLQTLADVASAQARTPQRLPRSFAGRCWCSVTLDWSRLLSGRRREVVVPVPGPVPALALKALAYRSRFVAKDALDVWRLFEVAAAARTSPDE